MIFKTEDLKAVCGKILLAVDNSELSPLTETLELLVENKKLYLNVTNREYFAQVCLAKDFEEDFHVTVNALLFLKLINQLTSENVELEVFDNYLKINANGSYKLPLIFDGDKLLELPKIELNNVVNDFEIDSKILNNIAYYNGKELLKGYATKPVQNLYYVDDKGAITFRSGACVTSFSLESPIALLLNDRLVKLFKLFKDEQVHFTLSIEDLAEDITQTKVRFETDSIILTAILPCDKELINSVPVKAIRGRAEEDYPYSVNVNKEEFLQAINRLLLFFSGFDGKKVLKPYGVLSFKNNEFFIYDTNKENYEKITLNNSQNIDYEFVADLADIKTTLECCDENYINLNFGAPQAFTIRRNNVCNIIPVCK